MEDDLDKIFRKMKAVAIKYRKIVFLVIILISIISIYKYIKSDEDIINISNAYKNKENGVEEVNNDVEKSKNRIIVHIEGEVNNKGVYTIDSDSRLNDLVNLAGGLTEKAESSKINLAKKLSDGEKIYIYAIGEENKNIDNIKEDNEMENNKININNANKSELLSLPGIGETTANKIIKYRDENGEFENIEDLQKVNGIGKAKFESIEDLICI